MTQVGDLRLAGSVAGVNDAGQAAGQNGFRHSSRAMLWKGGTATDLGTLRGDPNASATGINRHGQVVGISFNRFGPQHAFLWQDGKMTDLGALPGSASSGAEAINARGHVAGESGGHLWLWRDGKLADLGTLAGSTGSQANGINRHDHVVGGADLPGGPPHAILAHHGTVTDLNGVIPAGSGWVLQVAHGINDHGWIVGSGLRAGQIRGFLLIPHRKHRG